MASEVASKSDKLDHNMLSLRWNTMKEGVCEGGKPLTSHQLKNTRRQTEITGDEM